MLMLQLMQLQLWSFCVVIVRGDVMFRIVTVLHSDAMFTAFPGT